MDGHILAWTELNATQTYRVLGLYFSGYDSFLQIYGTQGAVTPQQTTKLYEQIGYSKATHSYLFLAT
jgi:hypothetical protein